MDTIEIKGTPYEVLQEFGFNRCAIRYDGGIVVIADRGPITGAWALTVNPATPEENKIIEALMPDDEVSVTQ